MDEDGLDKDGYCAFSDLALPGQFGEEFEGFSSGKNDKRESGFTGWMTLNAEGRLRAHRHAIKVAIARNATFGKFSIFPCRIQRASRLAGAGAMIRPR